MTELDRNGAPMPVPTDGPSMHDLVCADMQTRKQFGLARYGTVLQAHNGRDALQDLYEELQDALCYLKQLMIEREQTGHPHHLAAAIQHEVHYGRLRGHLTQAHGFDPADIERAADLALVQDHMDAHRLLKKDHEYQPWGTL